MGKRGAEDSQGPWAHILGQKHRRLSSPKSKKRKKHTSKKHPKALQLTSPQPGCAERGRRNQVASSALGEGGAVRPC